VSEVEWAPGAEFNEREQSGTARHGAHELAEVGGEQG
jgi:hypothetical protein